MYPGLCNDWCIQPTENMNCIVHENVICLRNMRYSSIAKEFGNEHQPLYCGTNIAFAIINDLLLLEHPPFLKQNWEFSSLRKDQKAGCIVFHLYHRTKLGIVCFVLVISSRTGSLCRQLILLSIYIYPRIHDQHNFTVELAPTVGRHTDRQHLDRPIRRSRL